MIAACENQKKAEKYSPVGSLVPPPQNLFLWSRLVRAKGMKQRQVPLFPSAFG